MATTLSTQDVKDVLASLSEEFLIEIPAVHQNGNYLLEYTTVAGHLVIASDEWFNGIAEHANNKRING